MDSLYFRKFYDLLCLMLILKICTNMIKLIKFTTVCVRIFVVNENAKTRYGVRGELNRYNTFVFNEAIQTLT